MRLIEKPKHGETISALNTMYPTKITCLQGPEEYKAAAFSTVYGICTKASCFFAIEPSRKNIPHIQVGPGSVFTLPCGFDVTGPTPVGAFEIFVIEKLGYQGMVGVSQVEKNGRLAYIDGCSDTCLFPPPRMGDPCLNALYFPPDIKQTQHLHPDIRVGVVLRGNGVAFRTGHWELPLSQGSMFILDEGKIHSFETRDEGMTVIAYHPTTDTGPTDQNHPMLNRTYINHGKV